MKLQKGSDVKAVGIHGEMGTVTAIRKGLAYISYRSIHPKVPGAQTGSKAGRLTSGYWKPLCDFQFDAKLSAQTKVFPFGIFSLRGSL